MNEKGICFIVIIGLILMMGIHHWEIKEKDAEIMELKQIVQENIKEKEVYMKMLEEYNGK